MIKSKIPNIKISGITCAVPVQQEFILDTYSSQFGEDAVRQFIKLTGVVSRHVAVSEQTASDLAYEAALYLVENKQIDLNKVGVLVFVTQTADYRLPASACVLQKRLGLRNDCIAFDVNLGCSGYVYGLHIVTSIMSCSSAEYGLLLVGDTSTKIISPEDRSAVMLFGDAGAATLIEKCDDQLQFQAGFRTDGSGFKAIIIPAGFFRNRGVTKDTMVWVDGNRRSYYDLYMNGMDVFNFSITQVPQLLNDYLSETGTALDHYDSFIMHQANTYMLKQIAKRSSMPMDKVPISMDRYGNTSVTSIPLTIADFYGKESGRQVNILMCGFGVGLSLGVVDLKIELGDIYPIILTDKFYTEGDVSCE